MKVGDIITNEYSNTGKIIEINGNEAIVEVFNYGIKNDIDYCDIKLCRPANELELLQAFEI